MVWNRIRGHSAQQKMLERAAARGRMAHAYLFLGPTGIGKRCVARALAQSLFCPHSSPDQLDPCDECPSCKQVRSGSHPDLLEIGCPEGKRDLPLELIVGSRERRGREGLCHDLALRPMASNRRIAIIDDAETMTEESANALLKTLEEPPLGSLMILLAPDSEAILPTIRSRCQPLWFSPLADEIVVELLTAEGIEPAQAAAVVGLCGGSLHTARQLLDSALAGLRTVVRKGMAQIGRNPLGVAAETIKAIEEGASDTAGQRDLARWAIRFAVEQIRERLRTDSDISDADIDCATWIADRCFEAEGHLQQSMPVPLCLAGLFDEISRIQRTGAPVAI
jgi:DNA polymerase-3 subunit delta'